MKASRLLSLLFLLRRRGARTAAQLAQELGVSARTLYRDVASLEAAGVPVVTSAGPGGGVALAPSWQTRLEGLTADEASALLFAGTPSALADLGLFGAALSGRAKLAAALPPDLRARMERVSERFFVDAPGWFEQREALPQLAKLARATWEGRELDLTYGERALRVAPLGLVLKAGRFYLVAAVLRDGARALRTLRVARVRAARLRREAVARPEGFALASYWQTAARAFEESLLTCRCELRLTEAARRTLPAVAPQESVRERLAEAVGPDARGWYRASLTLESEEVAAGQLLALGDGVEVLAPASLRARLRALARRVWARNGPQRARAQRAVAP